MYDHIIDQAIEARRKPAFVLQISELDYVTSSKAGGATVAENYVGMN